MVKEMHLPPRNTRRTEVTPSMEHEAPTEVLPVEMIMWRATLFVCSLLSLILATLLRLQFTLVNFATNTFKPKRRVFFFSLENYFSTNAWFIIIKGVLFRYD